MNKLSNLISNKYKLWPGLISHDDEGECVYGFQEAIKRLYDHQHPKDCSKLKFLIAEGWALGFGSEIHILSVGLALALTLDRVFIMNPFHASYMRKDLDNRWQVENEFCQKQKKINLECYFEPWTSCDPFKALDGRTLSDLKADAPNTYINETYAFYNLGSMLKSTEKVILYQSLGNVNIEGVIPAMYYDILSCSPIKKELYAYWWKAVAAAYMLRPNNATLEQFAIFKSATENPAISIINPINSTTPMLASNYPKPSDACVSIHVRHGDKHIENPLVPTSEYLRAAKYLKDHNLIQKKILNVNSEDVHYSIFLGSENPNVFQYAAKWVKKHNWSLAYTNIFDRRSVSTYLNHTEQQELRLSGRYRHHPWEYMSILLNLDYSLRCDAFICTTCSNSCRIIDELRSTVANKANRPYLDLSSACSPDRYCIDKGFMCI